jgi:hypothetical protein
MKNYTMEDVPNILNSISWQLKRIADSLEDKTELPVTKQVQESKKISKNMPDIRTLLAQLNQSD